MHRLYQSVFIWGRSLFMTADYPPPPPSIYSPNQNWGGVLLNFMVFFQGWPQMCHFYLVSSILTCVREKWGGGDTVYNFLTKSYWGGGGGVDDFSKSCASPVINNEWSLIVISHIRTSHYQVASIISCDTLCLYHADLLHQYLKL